MRITNSTTFNPACTGPKRTTTHYDENATNSPIGSTHWSRRIARSGEHSTTSDTTSARDDRHQSKVNSTAFNDAKRSEMTAGVGDSVRARALFTHTTTHTGTTKRDESSFEPALIGFLVEHPTPT